MDGMRAVRVLVLAGCACLTPLVSACVVNQKQLVVSRSPIPEQPVFTVIPVDLRSQEVEGAASIQACLLHYGMRVVERPAVKSAERREATGRTRATEDIVATFPEANADILIISYAASNRVKVLNKGRGYQLVLAETYPKNDLGVACRVVWYALWGLNLVSNPGQPAVGDADDRLISE